MSRLITETKEAIKRSGHKIADIIFIGSEVSGHSCTWKEFEQLANFDYDSGFGSQEVATDLIIVFSDGAKMWRDEYDGSEGWAYSSPFKMPTKFKPITTLCNGDSWASIEEMNRPGGKYQATDHTPEASTNGERSGV
jgi:hypothetical protein